MKDFEIVMCCFCGNSLAHKEAIEITISMINSEESQGLFCHRKCFEKVLHKDFPVGIDIDNENETSQF